MASVTEAAPITSPARAQLDQTARQIAALLFEADMVWQAFQPAVLPSFHEANYDVQLRYLEWAKVAMVLGSDYLRGRAQSATIASVPMRCEGERVDELFTEGDLKIAELAADVTTAEYPRQLSRVFREERNRR